MNKNIYYLIIMVVFFACIYLWIDKYIIDKNDLAVCPKQYDKISSTNFDEFKSQITFKEIKNYYFESKIPSYFGVAYFSKDSFELGEGYKNSYAIASSKSEMYITIDIIKTNEKDIPSWEQNECRDEETCKHYDYRDPVEDSFDEHYTYIMSGANWETIRSEDVILIIHKPYIQGVDKEEYFLVENFIKNLKFINP